MNPQHPLGEPAELAALYAAGALLPQQHAEFEAHLDAGCDLCRRELDGLYDAVAELAAHLPQVQPDQSVSERLMAFVEGELRPKQGATENLRPEAHSAATQTPEAGGAKAEATETGGRPPVGELVAHFAGGGGRLGDLFISRAANGNWEESAPGVRVRCLFSDPQRNQFTALVRMDPGTSYPRHRHGGPEECLVLEGDLRVGETALGPGDYQRAPAESVHGVQSTEKGCLLLIISSLSDEVLEESH